MRIINVLLALILLAGFSLGSSKVNRIPEDTVPPYRNSDLPIEQRIDDLLSRMTLEEKVGQMNMPCGYKKAIGYGLEVGMDCLFDYLEPEIRKQQQEGCRKLTRGNHNDVIGPIGGFFTIADRLVYEGVRKQAEFFNELQRIAMEETRLGIPLLFTEEGTHGYMAPGGTVFPEGLAIASSWNMDLVRDLYEVVSSEARATGAHMLCTIVIEPNRDPRMGRNQEGYSEDPYMCSEIARTIVKAMQGYDVSGKNRTGTVFTVFPCQTEPESGLERGAMDLSERTLRTVFLPPWVAGVKEAGALSVMAGYPAINGEVIHGSSYMLKELLREELQFKGIVLSEGDGISTLRNERVASSHEVMGRMSVMAGVDVGISMEDAYLGALVENVKSGKVPLSAIDDAVRNILYVKFKLGLFEDPYVDPDYADALANNPEHVELALQSAREGIVLLKNENNILPLKKDVRSIAVIGPNADAPIDQIGDYIPQVVPQDVVTVLEGIKGSVSPSTRITYVKGCEVIGDELNEVDEAVRAARRADIAVLVLGEAGYRTNGEGRDVASLDLTGMQDELLRKVHATGTPTIVVLINGRPLSVNFAAENVPGIIEAWMCGEQGGNAIAEVMFGDYNPSGRLPITVPRHSGQLPIYYNHAKNKWKKYIDMTALPLYEFGYGLSYTNFEYGNLRVSPEEIFPGGQIEVTVDVTNTGARSGSEVVQLYTSDVWSSLTTPVKELKRFEKVALEPGETKTVTFRLLPEDLQMLDIYMQWIVEPGTFEILVGASSEDIRLRGTFEVKEIPRENPGIPRRRRITE